MFGVRKSKPEFITLVMARQVSNGNSCTTDQTLISCPLGALYEAQDTHKDRYSSEVA